MPVFRIVSLFAVVFFAACFRAPPPKFQNIIDDDEEIPAHQIAQRSTAEVKIGFVLRKLENGSFACSYGLIAEVGETRVRMLVSKPTGVDNSVFESCSERVKANVRRALDGFDPKSLLPAPNDALIVFSNLEIEGSVPIDGYEIMESNSGTELIEIRTSAPPPYNPPEFSVGAPIPQEAYLAGSLASSTRLGERGLTTLPTSGNFAGMPLFDAGGRAVALVDARTRERLLTDLAMRMLAIEEAVGDGLLSSISPEYQRLETSVFAGFEDDVLRIISEKVVFEMTSAMVEDECDSEQRTFLIPAIYELQTAATNADKGWYASALPVGLGSE
ncbi:MAG: hypothetical protein NUW37_07435 [Planctomycetes bacterium]|nr:hypothetical protein [Planctomycetota bacterium]